MSDYIVKKLSWITFDFLEKFFFALFLLSIPIQTRLTFVTPQTYQNGSFNEYATFFIYLSDIFLIITFFLYFVNRLTKTKDFSIKFNRFYTYPRLIPIIFLAGFLFWSVLSAGWAEYPNTAIFQALKLAELILLALYISNRLLWFGLNKAVILIFFTGTFQAIIGISQYLAQKSLGLKILGESVLTPNLDNVAKIMVDGKRLIRAYGTFPHPNVFGAFLILSILLGFWLLFSLKIKEKHQNVSPAYTFIKKLFHACPSKLAQFLKKSFNLKQNQVNVSRETFLLERSRVKQFDVLLLNKPNFGNNNALADKCPPAIALVKEGETFLTSKQVGKTLLVRFLMPCIILQLTVLILTFSRIAWLATILLILFWGFRALKILYLKQKEYYEFHPPIFLLKLFHACPSKLTNFWKNLFNLRRNPVIVSRETILLERSEVKQLVNYALNKAKNLSDKEISAVKREIILIIITLLLIMIAFWPQINSRTIDIGNKYQQAIDYRVLYNNITTKIISSHPLTGIGNGNFTLKMKDYSPIPLEWWQYQPAHNIYLLIASEMGTIGLILFLVFIFYALKMAYLSPKKQIVSSSATTHKNVSRETIAFFALNKEKNFVISNALDDKREIIWLKYLILSIFIGFLFMGLFDHYFWTLQQGRITLWITIGLLLSVTKK